MQILAFVGFTALVAVISYWFSRSTDERSSDGYFLGGRSLGAVVIAGSLLFKFPKAKLQSEKSIPITIRMKTSIGTTKGKTNSRKKATSIFQTVCKSDFIFGLMTRTNVCRKLSSSELS